MGYEVFVYKFEDGDASHIPEGELESILSKYGAIVQGNFGTEFVSSVGEYDVSWGAEKDMVKGLHPVMAECFLTF